MKTILHINSSARYEESVSRSLSDKLVKKISNPEDKIISRDLNHDLHFVTDPLLEAITINPSERTEKQAEVAKFADQLIEELQNADTIIIGAPVYNFGPPANLKAWADLVARAGTTFNFTDSGPVGLLTGKKAWIVAVSGGTPVDSETDYMTPWLRFFLGFIGITDVEAVVADGILGQGGEEKIEAARAKIDQLTQ